ncbi:MAG: zinc-binding alcohol dehydrogenase family protein [Pseudonocardia sp.]|nr:zinc-binding alcohol dehydrogenase family protein [Pseudonocardia sp.]
MSVLAARVREAGRPPVVVELEPAGPGADEVTVELLAAPITPLDLLCAGGESYFGRPAVPYTPGVQGVGLCEGRPVWFSTSAGMAPGDGSMATHVTVPRAGLVPLPSGADPVLVAALGLSAVAAQRALVRRGGLTPGEQVVVLGGGGVVGQAAIQLARLAGARRVVAGARSAAARARAHAAGADAVVALDSDDLDELTARVAAAVDGPADLVLDPLYGVPAAAAAAALRPGGRLVNLGDAAGGTSPISSALLRSRSLRILGYTNTELTAEDRAEAVTHVAGLAASGLLTVSHESVTLTDAPAAWERQARGKVDGRIVLVPDTPAAPPTTPRRHPRRHRGQETR